MTMSIRFDPETEKQLTNLAESTGRTKSYYIKEAVGDYLKKHSWQIEAIKEGIESIEKDGGIPHEVVVRDTLDLILKKVMK